jgi:hypothetical protein
MFSEHDAMDTFSIYEHLLDILSLDDVLIDWRRLSAFTAAICFHHDLLPVSQGPEFSILEVHMLEVVVCQVGKGVWTELECILKCDLVLLEAKHVV